MDKKWGLWVVKCACLWCFTLWEHCQTECEYPYVSACLCFFYIPSYTILKLFYSYQWKCNAIHISNSNAGELQHILTLKQVPKSESAKKNLSVPHNMELESITLKTTTGFQSASWLFVPVSQMPETLNPTFPKVQLNSIFNHPYLVNVHIC